MGCVEVEEEALVLLEEAEEAGEDNGGTGNTEKLASVEREGE